MQRRSDLFGDISNSRGAMKAKPAQVHPDGERDGDHAGGVELPGGGGPEDGAGCDRVHDGVPVESSQERHNVSCTWSSAKSHRVR